MGSMASSNVESIYISSHRSHFMSYLTTSFEVAVAVQALLPCTTSTWSSLQKLWRLFIICMKLIGAPNLFMRRNLNFVHFMCFFTLILLVNQWLVPTLLCCWNFFCPFLLERPSSDLNLKYSYNLDQQGESLSLWFRHMPFPIIKSKEMWFARQALR